MTNSIKVLILSACLFTFNTYSDWQDYTFLNAIENQSNEPVMVISNVTKGDPTHEILPNQENAYNTCDKAHCFIINPHSSVKLRGWIIPYEPWHEFIKIELKRKEQITRRGKKITVFTPITTHLVERADRVVNYDPQEWTSTDNLGPSLHGRGYKAVVNSYGIVNLVAH